MEISRLLVAIAVVAPFMFAAEGLADGAGQPSARQLARIISAASDEDAGPTAGNPLPEIATGAAEVDGAETIFGRDGRKRVAGGAYPPPPPYTAVAEIFFNDGKRDRLCTGWMVSRTVAVTAGSCVHSGKNGDFYFMNTYSVFIGANSDTVGSLPYCSVIGIYTVVGWGKFGLPDFNIGALKLDCSVPYNGTTFGFTTGRSLKRQKFILPYYPEDKNHHTMWETKGRIRVQDIGRVFHKGDTDKQAAGAPLWYDFPSCIQCVMAINTYEKGGPKPGRKFNQATLITNVLFKAIKKWRNK